MRNLSRSSPPMNAAAALLQEGILRRSGVCPVTRDAVRILLSSTDPSAVSIGDRLLKEEERLRPPEEYCERLKILPVRLFRDLAGKARVRGYLGDQWGRKVIHRKPWDTYALAALSFLGRIQFDPAGCAWILDELTSLAACEDLSAETRRKARQAVADWGRKAESPGESERQLLHVEGRRQRGTQLKVEHALAAIRENPNITRKELANGVGVHPSTLTKNRGQWAMVNELLKNRQGLTRRPRPGLLNADGSSEAVDPDHQD